ncbi:MAG: hypothetical protein HN405_05750 [Planctomycetes bacterium]|jgi:regulator of protease activity HflC (stomatin/prohibitin superfamily)|nr:hypothetical protein [Planctomycetota bacterium]MBT4561012.1 hypothetical protein [Planctomycetota bacterium]
MKSYKSLIGFVVLVVLVPIFFALFFKRVPPATIGVKQGMWGGGIVGQDFPTGIHLGISGYHKWYFLPRKTHFLHFTNSRRTATTNTDSWYPPLEIRTTDNNNVTIELSVPYHIIENEAWSIVSAGLTHAYRERVESIVESLLREELPKLTSEHLQVTDKRLQRVTDALPELNRQLAELHCEADAILIRRIGFPTEYETKLQEKQFLRQKANLDVALTLMAEAQKDVNLIERQIVAAELAKTQEWDKQIQERTSENQVKIAIIRADADMYSRRTKAEGEADRVILEAEGGLAVEKSEALRNELRTAALDSRGGAILLGIEAAKNLNVPKVTLDASNPAVPMLMDLEALTRLLVGKSVAAD